MKIPSTVDQVKLTEKIIEKFPGTQDDIRFHYLDSENTLLVIWEQEMEIEKFLVTQLNINVEKKDQEENIKGIVMEESKKQEQKRSEEVVTASPVSVEKNVEKEEVAKKSVEVSAPSVEVQREVAEHLKDIASFGNAVVSLIEKKINEVSDCLQTSANENHAQVLKCISDIETSVKNIRVQQDAFSAKHEAFGKGLKESAELDTKRQESISQHASKLDGLNKAIAACGSDVSNLKLLVSKIQDSIEGESLERASSLKALSENIASIYASVENLKSEMVQKQQQSIESVRTEMEASIKPIRILLEAMKELFLSQKK